MPLSDSPKHPVEHEVPRILVLGSDPGLVHQFAQAVSTEAARVDVVSDLKAAMQSFEERSYAVFAADLGAIGLRTEELVEALKRSARARRTPLLVIGSPVAQLQSIASAHGDVVEALAAGSTHELLKLRLTVLLQLWAARLAVRRADEERDTIEVLLRLGLTFASELDSQKLVQFVTDEATRLTGAAFGAYFHNVPNQDGRYGLFSLSGAHKEEFASYPPVRATPLFAATFGGETVRYDDVTKANLYGHNSPHRGMPEGHVPVRSYLATPVRSRSGRVWGALFLGHSEPGRFTPLHERMAEALGAQAAVALDNSHLYREAEEAIRRRDEFLSIASHELNTPLTPLLLQLNVLKKLAASSKDDPALSKQVSHGVELAERQLGKLRRLIEDLLDVSRITAGRLHLDVEAVDLASVIEEVIAGFSLQAARVGSPIKLALEGELRGRWDRLRLEQLVTNLISNALKYAPGHPVHVHARGDGQTVRLTVQDEGPGIAPIMLSSIFERFERGGISGRHYGGLGLGLFIARQVAEALGGSVTVKSELGKGATFEVVLPLAGPSTAP